MSELEFILDEVKQRGHAERPWSMLRTAYFRGPDWEAAARAWASKNGLRVHFSDQHQSCLFQPIAAANPPR